VKGLPVCIFLVSVVYGAGWTVLAELPEGAMVSGIGETEEGIWYYEIIEDSVLTTVGVDLLGMQTVTGTVPYPGHNPVAEERYQAVPFPEDIESPSSFAGITKLGASGDTLWTVMLDSLEGRVDLYSPVIPCNSGGCFAVFAPDYDFVWKAYHLDSSGHTLMSSEFTMQGGPVIGIYSMAETAESGFLVYGMTDDLGLNISTFLVGIDCKGSVFLRLKEDYRLHAGAGDVKVSSSGDIYLSGYTGYERDDGCFLPPRDSDVFLIKLDSTGREIWRTVFKYPRENNPLIMEITENGDVLLLIRSFDYQFNGTEDSLTLLRYGE